MSNRDLKTSLSRDRSIIEVHQLTKTYGHTVRALDDLTFSVKSGTIFGLLDPNGAGKPTAIQVMTTLSDPDHGEVHIAGLSVIQQRNAVRRMIGCVAQKSGGDLQSTAYENLLLQGRIYGLKGRTLKARIAELLERFDLTHVAHRVCRTYSGGMRRKVA